MCASVLLLEEDVFLWGRLAPASEPGEKNVRHRPPFYVFLLLVALAATASAQPSKSFRASAFVGLGGGLDSEPDSGVDNSSFQLGFSWLVEPGVLVGIRYGELGLDGTDFVGDRVDSDLSYLTVAGEYLFNDGYYQSGVYIGLGFYDLETSRGPFAGSDSSVGLAVGVTGDFEINRRFSVLLEFSAHYAELEPTSLFAMGHVGVGYHF